MMKDLALEMAVCWSKMVDSVICIIKVKNNFMLKNRNIIDENDIVENTFFGGEEIDTE